MTYDEAVKFSNLGDVVIRFGIQNDDWYKNKLGTIDPVCGELVIPTVVVPAGALNTSPGSTGFLGVPT